MADLNELLWPVVYVGIALATARVIFPHVLAFGVPASLPVDQFDRFMAGLISVLIAYAWPVAIPLAFAARIVSTKGEQ